MLQALKRFYLVMLILILCSSFVYAEEVTLKCAVVNPELGTPEMVKLSFRSLFNWLSKKVGYKIDICIIPNVEETVAALKKNEIDLGYTGIVDFFRIQQQFPIEPAITFVRGTQNYYTGCLVVRTADAGLTIKDFTKKRFGFTSFHKQYGGLYPEILLKENGLGNKLDAFFSSVTSYYSDVPAIYDLLKNKIDVCAITQRTIDTLQENSPAFANKIAVIDRHEGLMFAPIFYRSDMKPELREKLIKECLVFMMTSEGQQLLMMFKLNGAKTVTDTEYKDNKAIAKRLGYLKTN